MNLQEIVKGEIRCNVSQEEYSKEDGIRSSVLRTAFSQPETLLSKEKRIEVTDEMKLGCYFEDLLIDKALGTNEVGKNYFVTDVERMPRKGSKGHDEMLSEAGNRMILKRKYADLAEKMVFNTLNMVIESNDEYINDLCLTPARVIQEGYNQVFMQYPYNGLTMKVLMDNVFFHGDRALIIDWKTTKYQAYNFNYAIIDRAYDIQAFMYEDAVYHFLYNLLGEDIKDVVIPKLHFVACSKMGLCWPKTFEIDNEDYGVKSQLMNYVVNQYMLYKESGTVKATYSKGVGVARCGRRYMFQ